MVTDRDRMGRKRGKKKNGRKKNGTATEGGTVPGEQKNTEDMLDSSPQPKVPSISYETSYRLSLLLEGTLPYFPLKICMAILKSGSNIVPDPAAQMYTDPSGSGSTTMYSIFFYDFDVLFGNRPTLFLVVVNLLQLA